MDSLKLGKCMDSSMRSQDGAVYVMLVRRPVALITCGSECQLNTRR